MHHIYHTKAFVLGSRQTGEDSKTIILYTSNLGLIYARAQGIRKISSKLRYTLQNFSYAKVDLVRGKEIWRITTAVPIHSNSDILSVSSREQVIARVSSLVARLVAGEEHNEEIFLLLTGLCETLRSTSLLDEAHCAKVELFYVTRVLMTLGYLSRSAYEFISDDVVAIPQILDDVQYRQKLIREINEALALSQL